jgi:hypothetical protein
VLPGAYLLLAILAVNLVVGGVIRIRKGRSTLGILIAHLGILLLVLGSAVEHRLSIKGQVQIWEGKTAHEFQSSEEWEVAILERVDGRVREHVMPEQRFRDLGPPRRRRFAEASLPFELTLRGYLRNCRPIPAGRGHPGVDGFVLEALEPVGPGDRMNVPGLQAVVEAPVSGTRKETLLWGLQTEPWVVEVAGRRFEIDLRLRRWPLPFALRLDRFVHELHPGTSIPKEYSSYVTKIDGGVAQPVHITMNAPLREGWYVFFQSGWGPEEGPPGRELYTVLSVVMNYSDRVPLIACIVIAAGLLLHLGRKLALHVKAEVQRREAKQGAPHAARA